MLELFSSQLPILRALEFAGSQHQVLQELGSHKFTRDTQELNLDLGSYLFFILLSRILSSEVPHIIRPYFRNQPVDY